MVLPDDTAPSTAFRGRRIYSYVTRVSQDTLYTVPSNTRQQWEGILLPCSWIIIVSRGGVSTFSLITMYRSIQRQLQCIYFRLSALDLFSLRWGILNQVWIKQYGRNDAYLKVQSVVIFKHYGLHARGVSINIERERERERDGEREEHCRILCNTCLLSSWSSHKTDEDSGSLKASYLVRGNKAAAGLSRSVNIK